MQDETIQHLRHIPPEKNGKELRFIETALEFPSQEVHRECSLKDMPRKNSARDKSKRTHAWLIP